MTPNYYKPKNILISLVTKEDIKRILCLVKAYI